MSLDLEQFKIYEKYKEGDYLGMFKSLLPRGFIWGFKRSLDTEILQDVVDANEGTIQDSVTSTEAIQDTVADLSNISDSLFGRLLSCFSNELARFSKRFYTLIREAVPGLSVELLEQHEEQLGLPDECAPPGQTLEERQTAAHTKYYQEYETTTNQHYIDYADSYGFTVTIDEEALQRQPRIMGVARMGSTQPRMGGRSAYSVLVITVTDGEGSLDYLKCVFQRIKQAHLAIYWIDAR